MNKDAETLLGEHASALSIGIVNAGSVACGAGRGSRCIIRGSGWMGDNCVYISNPYLTLPCGLYVYLRVDGLNVKGRFMAFLLALCGEPRAVERICAAVISLSREVVNF